MRFWKKRLQRVAAMVCSVALLASMMPTAAFAEGPTPTPTASVENATPTPSPDPAASAEPTVSPEPTVEPTQAPEGTAVPTAQPTPTPEGTAVPAESAASDAESTVEPSAEPTAQPTEQPAEEAAPSEQPQSDATAPESSANSDVETYGGWHDWDDDWWEDHFPDWGEDWDKGYYVWNVANITRKHNGGYELERVYHDDVNNPDHVSVYVSDQENGPYEMIAPHERAWEGRQWVARNERFIKIVPEKGYYVKYAVVACDYLGGYGCTVLADGDGYGTSTEPGDASIILVADESNHFYDHDDLAGTSVERFPYHVFIELAECPDPAYVVYDAGEAGGEQVTAAMLDGAIVSNDNGGIINNRNKTDVAFSFEDNPENYEVLAPTKNMVRVGNKTYEFVGWKLQYYSDDIDDVDDAFDMEDETNQEPTTVQPDGKIDLYAHAKLTAQWEEVEGPVVQPGAPVTVNVYLDGDPVKVTRNDQYIDLSLASTTDNPAVNVTPEGSYQCTYDYLTYNCADLQFTVNNSYVLQAVQADLVYGESGSKGVTTEKDTTKVDNVQGGSIVNIYLATPYSVEYYVDGELSETDETTYTVDNTADLPENGGLPSEDDPDSEGMQDASTVVWKMDPINDTITLKATDDLNAWYPKWKNGEVAGKIISGSLALSAILSDKDTYTVEDNTIKFFGTAQHKSVELTKEITSIQRGNETYTVETIPDGTLKVNDVITYEITVTNTGNVALNGLTVTDKFEGAGTPSSVVIKDGNGESVGAWNNKVWTVEDVALEKGESVVYTYTYTVDEADMGNTIKNTAAVTGEDGVNGKDTEETPAVENPDPVVDVEKEVTQIMRGDTGITNNVGEDNKLKVGDVITYKVTVSNKGNTTLTDLTVTDTFNGSAQPENGKNNQFALNWEPKEDGGWLGSFKFGKFEAGSSSYTTYNYTVTEADMGKTITNTVSVVDENGVKDEDKDTPQYPVEKAEPRVTVDKTYTAMRGDEQVPDGENLQVGDKITYQITVENTGNVTLKKLIVTDTFTGAGELENFTMDPDAGTKYKWTISDLAVGKDWTVTYTYTVIEADLGNTITNTAVVSGDADGKDDDPPTLPVEDESDAVAFDKKLTQIKRGNQTISAADISNDTMLQAGDVLTYTITVKNTGNVTVNDLTISDTFNGTGDQPQGGFNWTGKAGAWTGNVAVGPLPAGQTTTYEYTYTVVDTDKGATLKNEATLRIDEEYAGSVVNENVVADPSVTVDKTYTVMRDGKTVEVSNDNPLKVGDAITYTITVTNDGNIALENLTVTDNLNGKGEQPTGESITWTKDEEGWNGQAEIASMDVGQIFTFTYTYTVAEADLGSDNQPGSIKNTAVVNGGGLPEGGSEGETNTPVEPAGTVVVFDKKLTQIERGDETITDIDSNTALEVGDTLTYTITVTNNGNYTLTDLDIIDTFNGMGDEPTGSFTWEGEAGNRTATAKIESMGVGQVFTYNYTYTVQLEDVGKTLTNTAQLLRGDETLGGGKTENPAPKAPAYLFEKALTQIVRDGEPLNLDRIDDDTMLKSGDEITYTITVTNNGNVALNDLEITDTFNGLGDKPQGGSITWDGTAGEGSWYSKTEMNLPVGQTTTYTYTYTVVQQDGAVDAVKDNVLKNVATVSGAGLPQEIDPNDPTPPTDTDSRTVENDKITMQIADITTYMGGESGFDGAVGLDGEADQSTSLPEPGFYLTLPDEINAELTYAIGESDPNKVVDLSQYITIEAKDGAGVAHTWTLDKYGTDVSTALEDGRERYIYKINGEGDNAPIRVEFRDENGKRVTNDTFTADDALAANYTMTIYLGDVKVETIDFVINIPTSKDDLTTVRTYHCGFDKDESDEAATLTIRHTDEAVVTDAVSSIAEALKDETKQDQFLVEVQNDQDFNINEADGASGVSVDVKNVHLLADELEPLEEEAGLVQTAQEKAGFASSGTDAHYLDLVDAENGNAWLTAEQEVTVYWPYPAGTDKNTNFELFHYEGMDRDATGETVAPTKMEIVKGDTGLTFKTDNFSPFVLVWDTTTSTGGGDNSSNDNNNSNTNNTNDQTTTVNVTNEAPAPAAPTAATVPQTSDDMPVGALTAAAAAAAAALVVLLVVRKRRHGKD